MVNKSVLENAAAMVIFGTLSLVVKSISLSSGEIAFWRVAIALIAILTYKCFSRQKLPFKQAKGELIWLMASGIAIGGDWILFFEAYKYTSVSITTLSYYFCPVLVMILSPVVFRERVTPRQWLCFVMASIGLVLIIGARPSGSEKELLGIALGLGAALFYAAIIIINKRIKSIGGIDRTIFQFAVALVVLAVYVPLSSGFGIASLGAKGFVCLAILGLFHTALAYCLYFVSLRNITGQKLALLGYIDPLVAVLVSVLFFQEELTLWQFVGGLLIISFTIYNEISTTRDAERKAVSENA